MGAQHAVIVAAAPWLAKVVTNLCLNRLGSSRALRETYVGPWLPEPVLTSGGALGPLETAEQREQVSLGLLTLLERLTPTERAVFVLREAFDYSHREVAEVMELSEANCRQLHLRAARHLGEQRSRFPAKTYDWRRLVSSFLAAAQEGDLAGLERVLCDDVTAWADGGGRITAARRPIIGRDRVSRYLVGIMSKFGTDKSGTRIRLSLAEVNGESAVLAWRDEILVSVIVFELAADQIRALRTVANPDKLGYVARQIATQQTAAVSHSEARVGS